MEKVELCALLSPLQLMAISQGFDLELFDSDTGSDPDSENGQEALLSLLSHARMRPNERTSTNIQFTIMFP